MKGNDPKNTKHARIIPVGIVSNKEEGAVGQIVDHFFKDYIVSYAGDNMVRAKKPAKKDTKPILLAKK